MNINTQIAKLNKQDGWVSLVTFRVDQQVYALPIEPIRQIVEMVTVTAVPQVKEFIEGVINFHGVPVPVINLRRQLALPLMPFQLHTPIVLVTMSNRLVGVIVDEVLDVLNLPKLQIIDPEVILPEGMGEISVLQGLIQLDGKTILCLNLDHLLAPQQANDIAAVADALAKNPEGKPAKKGSSGKRSRRETVANEEKVEPVEIQPEVGEA